MVTRCTDPRHPKFERYGGRGIGVQASWLDPESGFARFVADVGNSPGHGYSLDRIDNDRGYEIDNVRWATPKEQARNRSCTAKAEIDGVVKSVGEWAEISGVKYSTIMARQRAGRTGASLIARRRLPNLKSRQRGAVSLSTQE